MGCGVVIGGKAWSQAASTAPEPSTRARTIPRCWTVDGSASDGHTTRRTPGFRPPRLEWVSRSDSSGGVKYIRAREPDSFYLDSFRGGERQGARASAVPWRVFTGCVAAQSDSNPGFLGVLAGSMAGGCLVAGRLDQGDTMSELAWCIRSPARAPAWSKSARVRPVLPRTAEDCGTSPPARAFPRVGLILPRGCDGVMMKCSRRGGGGRVSRCDRWQFLSEAPSTRSFLAMHCLARGEIVQTWRRSTCLPRDSVSFPGHRPTLPRESSSSHAATAATAVVQCCSRHCCTQYVPTRILPLRQLEGLVLTRSGRERPPQPPLQPSSCGLDSMSAKDPTPRLSHALRYPTSNSTLRGLLASVLSPGRPLCNAFPTPPPPASAVEAGAGNIPDLKCRAGVRLFCSSRAQAVLQREFSRSAGRGLMPRYGVKPWRGPPSQREGNIAGLAA